MESSFKGIPKIIFYQVPPKIKRQMKSHLDLIDLSDESSYSVSQRSQILNLDNSKIKEKNEYDRRKSQILNACFFTVIFSKTSMFERIILVFYKILFVHTFVVSLTAAKMVIQNYMDAYCWLPNVCECKNDFQTKIYALLSTIFINYNLFIMMGLKTAVEILFKTDLSKLICLFLYYALNFISIFVYLLVVKEENYQPFLIFGWMFAFVLLLQTKNLYDNKFSIKLWIINIVKINIVIVLFFIHYMLCLYGFPKFSENLNQHFGVYMGKNICHLLYFIYFNLFNE